MDKDEEGEEEEDSEAFSQDDPYQVNNPMHNMLVQEEGGVVAPGLVVLAEAISLVVLGKGLIISKKLQFQT